MINLVLHYFAKIKRDISVYFAKKISLIKLIFLAKYTEISRFIFAK